MFDYFYSRSIEGLENVGIPWYAIEAHIHRLKNEAEGFPVPCTYKSPIIEETRQLSAWELQESERKRRLALAEDQRRQEFERAEVDKETCKKIEQLKTENEELKQILLRLERRIRKLESFVIDPAEIFRWKELDECDSYDYYIGWNKIARMVLAPDSYSEEEKITIASRIGQYKDGANYEVKDEYTRGLNEAVSAFRVAEKIKQKRASLLQDDFSITTNEAQSRTV